MERVLLVEDEKRMRDIVRDYFAAHGLECDLARDGEEALERLRERDYDAVLLDVNLPDGDGFSLLGKLRENRDVPVLFLSARDEDEARLRGLGLGADDYITKPFNLSVVYAKTMALIRRSRGSVRAGDRMELEVPDMEYGLLVEGDRGRLTFQGTRFLGFERM